MMSMQDPVSALIIFFIITAIIATVLRFRRLPFFLKDRAQAEKMLIEDILKQLYHVEYSGRTASFNDMAGALKMKDDKLVSLLEKSADLDLVINEDGKLKLTSQGEAYALRIIRNHRLWEKYLSERTGIDKMDWHRLAEKMEHRLNPSQAEKLNNELGNPRFDPHGDPIPTSKGEIINIEWKPLSGFKSGTTARIVHIEDEPEVVYRQIAKKLHIGSQIKVLESTDHVVKVFSEGKTYSFTPIVASNVSAVELKDQELFEENAARLSQLKDGDKAKILGISSECRGASRRRLLDLGFIPGTVIESEFSSPMKNPKAYVVRNTLIALRNDQADLVLIERM